MHRVHCVLLLALGSIGLTTSCAYHYYAGNLRPMEEAVQGEGKRVTDDGSVIFTAGRLEIQLRPMNDEELNRQFSVATEQGTNPYTYGRTKVFRTDRTPSRFTVFRLSVKNYAYPKVHIDPTSLYIETDNGRKYFALSFAQLKIYYRSFSLGGSGGGAASSGDRSRGMRRGGEYHIWQERQSILRRTLFADEMIFSGQEREGYVVFKNLAPDVARLTVHIPDIAVRFDFRDQPIETIDVASRFERDIGREYPDGRIELARK